MEAEQLILKDSRAETYCISFLNAKGFKRDEIERIFSQFGPIASINETGTERGYRFVRYPTYGDARNAVEGLRDHPHIKLFPPHDRKNAGANNSGSQQKKSDRKNDRKSGRKQSAHSRDMPQRNEQRQHQNMTAPWKQGTNTVDNFNAGREEWNESSHQQNVKAPWEQGRNGESDFNPNRGERNGHHHQQNTTAPWDHSTNGDGDFPMSRGEKSLDDRWEERKPGAFDANSQIQLVIAGEVIVGNIHPDFGSPYILHLLDSFEPIAITKIKILPQTSIRYCHVYFKSHSQSMKVEKQFDGMNLSQQKLIVLRPDRLVRMRA
ncbi:hypothetical protein QAD02_016555 [Eretmocerus hayati]|uniref:Uncharacterized protein n=1 Tax=Eretmocerus hayati TaxID=131215 RepID=A0ACC2PBE8_9HYME|nr:hypothetical protein QAD02_016555 [Eretmocerus hayati]